MDAYNTTIIWRAKAELAVAIRQSTPTDDKIIMRHVDMAYRLLAALDRHYHAAGEGDECALCGRDSRDGIHFRTNATEAYLNASKGR